jgi:hypothetical protein
MSKILKVRMLLYRAEVNRPVFFGALGRMWGLLAGPITAMFIATKFTPEVQGYYYTFSSILAMQVFIELGLGLVIVQFASHEWSKLAIDGNGGIVGDEASLSRLASLMRIALKWYGIGSVVATFGLSIGGFVFFSRTPSIGINWVVPWFVLCLLTGINIYLSPIWSLLEGCNQVSSLYTYRFIQGVVFSITMWISMASGMNLWSTSIVSFAGIICAGIFLKGKYWRFFKTLFFVNSKGPSIGWRTEILPMQWRIALSWACSYLTYSIFIPISFKYLGVVVAGQMGMTWSLMNVVGAAGAYFYPKVPTLGVLVAQKKYESLDVYFWKVVKIFTVMTIVIALLIYVTIWFLNWLDFPFAVHLSKRILPLNILALFLLAQLVMTVSTPFSYYMFAHKKNPLTLLTVVNGALTGLSTFFFGKYYSAFEIALSFFSIQLIVVLFILLIWYQCRDKWHSEVVVDMVEGDIG